MLSPERVYLHDFSRWAAVGAITLALAGCFQPMYADRSVTGGTGPNLRDAMRDVEVVAVDGRLGQEIRNDIIFELTGGSGNPSGAPYKLNMTISNSSFNAIIDANSGLAQTETVALDVNYRLKDVANDKVVLTDKAIARVTIDRTAQRYARVRAVRDAENKAAKIVAEQMRARVASFFLIKS
jgi:LPS-assembly lipoprotein